MVTRYVYLKLTTVVSDSYQLLLLVGSFVVLT